MSYIQNYAKLEREHKTGSPVGHWQKIYKDDDSCIQVAKTMANGLHEWVNGSNYPSELTAITARKIRDEIIRQVRDLETNGSVHLNKTTQSKVMVIRIENE